MSWFSLNDDFDALEGLWLELGNRIDAPLEYSPGWLKASAESISLLEQAGVLVDFRGDSPVSFTPLLLTKVRAFGLECSGWEMPGLRLVANHSELVTRDNRVDYLKQLLDNLPEPNDILIMPAIVESSETERAIIELTHTSSWRMVVIPGDESPYLPIETSWDSFLSSRRKKFRYMLRKKEETLSQRGIVTERWFHDRDSVDKLFADMLEIEEYSWKVAAGMAISRRPNEQRYYRLLLAFLADSNALAANVLYIGAEPTSYSLCYSASGRLSQLKTSFKEVYAEDSPGFLSISHAIRYAFENGFSEFDFLGDVMPHKMHWTDSTRRHADYFLFGPRVKSRVIQVIKSTLARLRGGRKHRPTLGRSARK
jgi:CelD/BcsL family acetyltransferase involved in cellulose biosynthesis